MQREKISIVIICKNAISSIKKTLQSAFAISDDVVIIDSGSTDGTLEIISSTSAKLFAIDWKGYGQTKNYGSEKAKNNWIFSLDADEYADNELQQALQQADLLNSCVLFRVKRLNYLGNKPIHFGEWGNDFVIRIFNKKNASWDASTVHEQLIIKDSSKIIKIKGCIHHYTAPDIETFKIKSKKYAFLMAEKYAAQGKKAHWYKIYFSPVINFVQNYIFKAGFLDGKAGWQIAMVTCQYTYEKYKLLYSISKSK